MNEKQASIRFGKWLSRRRRELGYSQQALAQRVGCSRGYLAKLEAGLHPDTGRPIRPGRGLVIRIARILSSPVDQVLVAAGYAPEAVPTPNTPEEAIKADLRADDDLTPADIDAIVAVYRQIKRSKRRS